MATGPREKQKKWADTNSSTKNLYSQKILNEPHNSRQFSTGENNSPAGASDDSSSHNRVQLAPPHKSRRNGDEISLPGYVQFDNKVRISLNSGSKSVIRELKRKLVSELDQVRSLKTKLEATEFHNDTGLMGSVGASCSNRVGTLARVNSEVSYVGPAGTRPLQGLARSRSEDREKKTPMIGKEKVSNSGNNSAKLMKQCAVLLEKLMKHKFGWVFNKPVDAKKLNLLDYHKIIKHPMDLGTVNTKLRKNLYKSPKGFAEDVRLTFNNAKTYNEKGQDAHIMADVLLKLFEEKWAVLKAEYHFDEKIETGVGSSKKHMKLKKNPAPAPAPAPAPLKKHSGKKLLDRADFVMKAKIVTAEDETKLSKKLEEKEPQREMTFEEKKILSNALMSLPSEKLGSVVQIIKKRNPELFQQEDEIELDIDSVDSETLWELNRLVIGDNQTKEVGLDLQETNVTPNVVQALGESFAGEKNVNKCRVVREGDNINRSCSSSSSSDGSGSSSSDSDSSSSGYCSDTGQ